MSHISCVPIPSPAEVEARQTPAGGYTKRQLAEWGVGWPLKAGWKLELAVRYAQHREEQIRIQFARDPARLERYVKALAEVDEAKSLLDQAQALYDQRAAQLQAILRRAGL